jgi:hypothetical protein
VDFAVLHLLLTVKKGVAMLEYVRKCKEAYEAGKCPKVEFIKCVYDGAVSHARDKNIVKLGTKALRDLSLKYGRYGYIPIEDIAKQAGFKQYRGSGLWPWREKNADVVEQEKGHRAYRIKKEFFEAFHQALSCI